MGDFQIGHLPAEEYARKAREYAKLMRRVDRNINLTAVGDGLEETPEWNLTVLNALFDLIDYISTHEYYDRLLSGNEEEDYYRVLACPVNVEKRLRLIKSTIEVSLSRKDSLPHVVPLRKRDLGLRDIGISFDEWNISGCHTLRDALGISRLLNAFQRVSNSLKIGCLFPLIRFRTPGRAPITAYGDALILEVGYYAFNLYVNHTGEVAVDSSVESKTYKFNFKMWRDREVSLDIPYLDSSATLSNDGKVIYLATVNAHRDEDMECLIELRDCSPQKTGKVFELNAGDVNAYNDKEHKDDVKVMEKPTIKINLNFTYTFPAHSATVIEIPIA